MCPLWPLHYVALVLALWMATCRVVSSLSSWSAELHPSSVEISMYNTTSISFNLYNLDKQTIKDGSLQINVNDPTVASIAGKKEFILEDYHIAGSNWSSSFNITGNFLGYTSVSMKMKHKQGVGAEKDEIRENVGSVTVVRGKVLLDRIFTSTVIALICILFINFGCALDISLIKKALLRPVGPLIGLTVHYLLLPLISYGLGLLLFPESKALRLGLFFTATSPAGGASNIWTFTLGGNFNLSIIMTTISTLASLAMIPLWSFTLARVIMTDSGAGQISASQLHMAWSTVALLIPLLGGYILQRYCKRISNILVRCLKPFSILLILFIIVFATITNLYLFQLFTWQIVVAGLGLPCIGYFLGWQLARLLGQSPQDILAISVETGVQNTGVAIYILRVILPQPAADITTVVPVSVALMTPVPLLILYLWKWSRGSLPSKDMAKTSADRIVQPHDIEQATLTSPPTVKY